MQFYFAIISMFVKLNSEGIMKMIYSLVIGLIFANFSYGQWGYIGGSPHINPRADQIDAIGKARKNDAISRSIDEQTRSRMIQNNYDYIIKRWEIKDEYKQRSIKPTYLERLERSYDIAEKIYALKQREEDLIKRGILKPKPESCFYYKYKKFSSFEEFKNSLTYQEFLIEKEKRNDEINNAK